MGQGRKLAEGLGQQLCAVVIGKDVEQGIREAEKHGADKIYVVQGDSTSIIPRTDTDTLSFSFAGNTAPIPYWWEQPSTAGTWVPSLR